MIKALLSNPLIAPFIRKQINDANRDEEAEAKTEDKAKNAKDLEKEKLEEEEASEVLKRVEPRLTRTKAKYDGDKNQFLFFASL